MLESRDPNWTAWHRIFGVVLTDLFVDTPYEVELEKDLSIKQQFLDIVIVRKRPGTLSIRLPDGLEDLAEHNLITYKSMNEALDDWSLKELTGHYVNYRKQIGDQGAQPENAFRLFGVSTRYPKKLADQLQLTKKQDGVYETQRGTDAIRIIVLREIRQEAHNAFWQLFSAVENRVRYGAEYYKFKESNTTTVLTELFGNYTLEGLTMPFTVEQFIKESRAKVLRTLSDEERNRFLQSMSDEERNRFLQSLSIEERLSGMTFEEIKAFFETRQAKPNSNSTSED